VTRAGTAILTLGLCVSAAAAEPRHGLSVFGDLKYPEGFTHFDYVNPDAPKGGRISLIGPTPVETFDSFNGYILKGDPAQGFALMFDSLMARASDEPDAMYGLVAKTAEVADGPRERDLHASGGGKVCRRDAGDGGGCLR
jgi:microcin C transport system substrate-binding protein